MEIVTKSAAETQEFGKKFAANLVISQGPSVIALSGELGSGKTTFVQGLAEGLGIKQRIISPTFILLRTYCLAKSYQLSAICYLYHVDLYRLEGDLSSEIENLGLPEIWSDPKNIVAIEWAEKIKNFLSKNTQWLKFEHKSGDERKIIYGS